jgi:histidinol phosphatase-like PHP family hydrolase
MKTRILLISIILAGAVSVQAQRRILSVPELPGYVTLKCDFHMHTVFSDGNVWPTQRVGEAWRDGLDAIAITDHLEYQPKKQYIPTDHSAAWKIARSTAADYNIILVKGSEITRKMPPGHLNALFISEPDSLVKDDFMKAVEAAVAQGAFIEWNHPGWKSQQPDGIPRMYPVHEELIAKGWLHGIEYYNDVEFYPLVMDMCRDNKLALMGNSDVHGVISEEFAAPAYSHRPMTLVFARERTHDSLKEAMFARRTAVWYGDNLAAFEDIAAPLFKSVITAGVPFRDDGKNIWFELSNSSDIPMTLSGGPSGAPATLKIPARGMVVVRADRKFLSEPIPYSVDNIITGSNSVLKAEISPAKR